MVCGLTNFNAPATNAMPYFVGSTPIQVRASYGSAAVNSRPIFSVETFSRIELSLVPEIERVFFEHEGDKEFRIISVVNKRDVAIREKVYASEEEIMKAFPGLSFDFHVMARMDRKIEDVITKAGKLVFDR